MEQAVNVSERRDLQSVVTSSTESESPNQPTPQESPEKLHRAKEYSRIKIILGIAGTILFFILSLVFVLAGVTRWAEGAVRGLFQNDYLVLLGFSVLLGVIESTLTFPMQFYSGYYLEHRYQLSNQSFLAWVWEGVKGMLVGVALGTPLLLAFYYCLKTFGSSWWLPVGTIVFLFSVIIARIAPVLIFPLFYKFKPLEEGALNTRILALCKRVGIAVQGVFVFDMSKNTKKANAAFSGIGKSKRIILGDTLVANFTDDEIESIFAHELGHYTMKHIWIMIMIGTVNSFVGLYLAARAYEESLLWFGFTSIDQIAALPLLTLWLGLYSLITGPFSNMVSRAHERAADRYAVRAMGNGEPFVNALKKLASINLTDPAPNKVIEFLFHSHPSIEKRILAVEQNKSGGMMKR
ncbi:MAG: M48 family metallopeptidase [bacterium]